MTKEIQSELFDQIMSKAKKIMMSKGDDYANTDRLSNFKIAGVAAGGDGITNILNAISTKVVRLSNLLVKSNKVPNNESVEDSTIDLINYAALLYMLLSEMGGVGRTGIKMLGAQNNYNSTRLEKYYESNW